ncbi:MAG: TIGR04283 family arsenosugar biosynthesis glycosyltransferase [Planctomycetaceae bacterium]|nr:TIGR04283 family arsenosugar biosynthesis glycosyltransferase [Planctomycetaceae bacterium]
MDISVIIPTLNESATIAQTVQRTRALGACEIIVVDGGSHDGTLAAAGSADQCLNSPRGRAAQQNRGAAVAGGDVLLFLHADCWLEAGAFEAMQHALSDSRCVGGCFRQMIDAEGWGYRTVERGNALRVRWLKWIYGDQALFVRREVFQRVGGYPELELMEDLYISKRLKRKGRLWVVDHSLHVSPRRWQQVGLIRQTLRNWAFVGLAHCGVSPHRLARHYANIR